MIKRWRDYWRWYGVPYGLFQGFMACLIVASFLGMMFGLAWMVALAARP